MANEFYQYNGQIYQYKTNQQGKEKKASETKIILLAVTVAVLAIICIALNMIISKSSRENGSLEGDYVFNSIVNDFISDAPESTDGAWGTEDDIPVSSRPPALTLLTGSSNKTINGINSRYAIIINRSTGEIIASKNANVRMFPASMTKIMAVLVAYEYTVDNDIDLMTSYATMTKEIADHTFVEGAAVAGFKENERVRLHDLFYGAILPSGADAVLMLANFCGGNETAFVQMMNAKAKELGLSETNFVTSTGLHHPDHYTTVAEMAVITDYACKYDFLRNLLTATHHTYAPTNVSNQRLTTSTLYNWRTAYISAPEKTLVSGAYEFGGKIGYTPEAKYCLSTFATISGGESYIVVTGFAEYRTDTVKDYLKIYNEYLPKQ